MSLDAMIYLPKLIEAAKAAVLDNRLGIQRGAVEPMFVYEDGSVCAIATALPQEILTTIRRDEVQRLNWLELRRAGYFEIDTDLRLVEALATFQTGYDFCCTPDRSVQQTRTQSFCQFILSIDPRMLPEEWV